MICSMEASAFSADLSEWDTSQVTNMGAMFGYTERVISGLSRWNVSQVRDMTIMFAGSLFNDDISMWNVANVENIHGMFALSTLFNQDLCAWGQLLRPNTTVDSAFQKTGCPSESDPDLGAVPPGPFCFVCTNE